MNESAQNAAWEYLQKTAAVVANFCEKVATASHFRNFIVDSMVSRFHIDREEAEMLLGDFCSPSSKNA